MTRSGKSDSVEVQPLSTRSTYAVRDVVGVPRTVSRFEAIDRAGGDAVEGVAFTDGDRVDPDRHLWDPALLGAGPPGLAVS